MKRRHFNGGVFFHIIDILLWICPKVVLIQKWISTELLSIGLDYQSKQFLKRYVRAMKLFNEIIKWNYFQCINLHRPSWIFNKWALYVQPTTNPNSPTHRPTGPIIIFKRLGNRKIFILQNTHTAEKNILGYYLLYLMNNICLHNFEHLQMKSAMVAHKINLEELTFNF